MTGGDASDAVRSMYVEHAAALHGYASRRVGRDLADDVVAETFRRAIESFDAYDRDRDPGADGRAWLFGIATNLLRRHWRTEQRRLAAFDRQPGNERSRAGADPLLAVPERVDAERDSTRVLAAVAALDREDYELLVLVAWEQMSSGEVAHVLGIARGTVRSRLHRIRGVLDTARREPAPTETAAAGRLEKRPILEEGPR